MWDGSGVLAAFRRVGVTHVVWLPDSELGLWDAALSGPDGLPLVRVCREGEACAVAGGLALGGKRPIVLIQCTGLFEAGDALRNFVHDLKLPLFFVVGIRSYRAHQAGRSRDSCPVFAEPIVQAWRIPYVVLDPEADPIDRLTAEYERSQAANRAGMVLLVE
jgi:sulfopyruvate decarboxylase TPP-binding subunit